MKRSVSYEFIGLPIPSLSGLTSGAALSSCQDQLYEFYNRLAACCSACSLQRGEAPAFEPRAGSQGASGDTGLGQFCAAG